MAGLTQEQADLLYAAILHNHDDLYAALGHLHDERYAQLAASDPFMQYLNQTRGDARYSQLGHNHSGVYSVVGHQHTSRMPVFFHALSTTIAAGATVWLIPGVSGYLSSVNGTTIPLACTVKNLYVRLNGTQPAGGSIVVTLQKSTVDQSLAVTIPANSTAGAYSDLSNSVTFLGGETLGIKIKNNASGASAPITSVAVELQPATQ